MTTYSQRAPFYNAISTIRKRDYVSTLASLDGDDPLTEYMREISNVDCHLTAHCTFNEIGNVLVSVSELCCLHSAQSHRTRSSRFTPANK